MTYTVKWISVSKLKICKRVENASVSGVVEADEHTSIDLDEDLFQHDNGVDAEDYTDMVDELQQGNEDVVFANIDQENEDVDFGLLTGKSMLKRTLRNQKLWIKVM